MYLHDKTHLSTRICYALFLEFLPSHSLCVSLFLLCFFWYSSYILCYTLLGMLSQTTTTWTTSCVIVCESSWMCTQQVDITPYYMCFVLISLWRVSQHPLNTHNINMKRVKMAHEQILSTDPDTHLCFRAFWFASFSFIAWYEAESKTSTTAFLFLKVSSELKVAK